MPPAPRRFARVPCCAALIKRQRGEIQDSLQLFQAATCLNPNNINNLKQVGRSLYLLGKHKAALDVYKEAMRLNEEDWEVWHNQGLCYTYLKQYEKAIDCFKQANSIQQHDVTYIQLGKVYTLQEDFRTAIDVYLEALDFSPDNPEMLTTVGLLYLRLGENYRAFDFLGNSLTHDPRNPKTILAAGSIIQDHSDMDVALVKYRVAAVATPNSAQLWNNIGMCFFGKQRYVAAIACLKRALYLDPFEWIISYNLGLVHLNTGQYASAFHFFSSSINLKPDFPSSYMYLAITLSRLDDFDNACSAYEKAIEMEECARRGAHAVGHTRHNAAQDNTSLRVQHAAILPMRSPFARSLPSTQHCASHPRIHTSLCRPRPRRDHLFELNFSITLYNNDEIEKAAEHFRKFEELYAKLDDDTKNSDPDIAEQRQALAALLPAR